jgi:Ca2+-binding RTX toxin-like protein
MKKVTRKNFNNKTALPKTQLLEKLEDRRLMSASVQLVDGMLILQGNARGHNRITVSPDEGGQTLFARAGKAKGHYLQKDVKSIYIVGGERPDEIAIDSAIKKRSFIRAGKGADTVIGGGGSDSVFGGPGNDSITGGAGDDLLQGQGGIDLQSDLRVLFGPAIQFIDEKYRFAQGQGHDKLNILTHVVDDFVHAFLNFFINQAAFSVHSLLLPFL